VMVSATPVMQRAVRERMGRFMRGSVGRMVADVVNLGTLERVGSASGE